jgi:flagellar basal body-associated protein FliL
LGTISLNELSDKTIKFLIIGVALGVSLVIIVAGAFYLGKKSVKQKAENKNDTSE